MNDIGGRPERRFSWFVPIDGDVAHIGTLKTERPPTFNYLKQVVQTAEDEGYYSLLIPTRFANGLFEEREPLAETWTTVTALAAVTDRIRFLVAVRPGFISTGLFAQMAAALDNISNGRTDLNVVPGGIQGDFEPMGAVSDHAHRYARAEEIIEACRKMWAGSPEPVDYKGKHIQLDGAIRWPGPVGDGPKFYLSGASDAPLGLAGRQSDTYLAWIMPQEGIAAHISRANEQFEAAGRKGVHGLRTHIIVRDTEDEAWGAAGDLLSRAETVVKGQRQAVFAGTAMVGQRAQVFAEHRVGDHLWNGISAVRVNCGTAIVGSPQQVAEELMGYWRLGIDEFILSGYPHVEECSRVARDVLPIASQLMNAER